jgi:hypothetical protein
MRRIASHALGHMRAPIPAGHARPGAFTPLLPRRLKLVAAGSGKSLKALDAEALDALCRQHDM